MRAAEDPEHTAILHQMRYPKPGQPRIPIDYIKRLRKLTSQDIAEDRSWSIAPIIVTTNSERHHINNFRSSKFAEWERLPRIIWRIPLDGPIAACLPTAVKDRIYAAFPQFTGCFVQGAPGYLSNNINTGAQLYNSSYYIAFDLFISNCSSI